MEIKWNKSPKEILGRIFDDETMTYVHTRLHAYMSPYVPMDSGMMDQTVDIKPEYDHYKSPYSHFQWEGKVFVDDRGSTYARRSESKHATSKDLNYSKDKHPLATAHWEQAAIAAKGDELCKDITDYLRRK